MHGLRLVIKDLKAMLSITHGRIALVFLAIVPLIYVGIFLAGYWNPYGKLDKLPVAVVNLDRGSMMNNQALNLGDDLVNELKSNRDFEYHSVSPNVADTGLRAGQYFFVVNIPENFSHNVATLMDKHPQPAELTYETNPGKSFIASEIASSAMEQVKDKLSQNITESYTKAVFQTVQEMAHGFNQAAQGSETLSHGTKAAENGMQGLNQGILQVTNGAVGLEQGTTQLSQSEQPLHEGMQGLKQGTSSLSSGLSQLVAAQQAMQTSVQQLAIGTSQLANGSNALQQGQMQVENAMKEIQSELTQYVQSHPDASQDPEFASLENTSSGALSTVESLAGSQAEIAQNASQLAEGQSTMAQGMNQFGDKLTQVAAGSEKLAVGANHFTDGLVKWQRGFNSIIVGVGKLANGAQQVNQGANTFSNGLTKLSNGSVELSKNLSNAANKTTDLHTGNAVASIFAAPVKLVESNITNVPNYGTGMAPYFLSLGLYVGGIMAANILPLARRKDAIGGTGHFINKLFLFYALGVIQTVIVDLVVLYGFKLHVLSTPKYCLYTLLVSLTFQTIVATLASVFGIVGKFSAITLLILQLASCGGTFPMQLNSPFMQALGRILPMTYSVRGFQDIISIGDWSFLFKQVIILLAYLVGAAIVKWVVAILRNRKHVGTEMVGAAH